MDLRSQRLEAARLRPTVRRYVQEALDSSPALGERPGESAALVLRKLRRLRVTHRVPAFGVALWELAGVELDEEDAEACWVGLARHREAMARDLGRDPGWVVVTADFLSTEQPLLTSPAVGTRCTEPSQGDALEACLNDELRRSARSGHPFTVIRIPDFERRARQLERRLRETDRLVTHGDGEVVLILPGSDAVEARRCLERLGRELGPMRAGIATCEGQGMAEELLARAAEAIADVGVGQVPWSAPRELAPRRGADEA